MNELERQRRIQELVENYGLDEEDAAFAVRLAAGESQGDRGVITLPLPEAEANYYIDRLIDQHGFTLDEATRYVAGDRTAIEAVAARRKTANEGSLALTVSRSRTSKLSAD